MNMIAAFKDTLDLAAANGMANSSSDIVELDYGHLASMYKQILENPDDFSEAKLGRWLGWCQAAVVANCCGDVTLEDMKTINKRHAS